MRIDIQHADLMCLRSRASKKKSFISSVRLGTIINVSRVEDWWAGLFRICLMLFSWLDWGTGLGADCGGKVPFSPYHIQGVYCLCVLSLFMDWFYGSGMKPTVWCWNIYGTTSTWLGKTWLAGWECIVDYEILHAIRRCTSENLLTRNSKYGDCAHICVCVSTCTGPVSL